MTNHQCIHTSTVKELRYEIAELLTVACNLSLKFSLSAKGIGDGKWDAKF